MKSRTGLAIFGCGWLAVCTAPIAQELVVVPPPMEFETSAERFAFLLEQGFTSNRDAMAAGSH
ncbi:MAG: hypothetical protein OXG98_10010 [Gemmatimonadetes bacterium]|nr:hypothetical protein [Gemmatimonadota bacterium]